MLEMMRELRRRKGLSMKELGEKVGVAEVTISTYERGRSQPPLDVLCAIADTLDVSLDMLVRGKEKDRHEGRSLEETIKLYRELNEDQLQWFIAVLQATLADKRFQARQGQGSEEKR